MCRDCLISSGLSLVQGVWCLTTGSICIPAMCGECVLSEPGSAVMTRHLHRRHCWWLLSEQGDEWKVREGWGEDAAPTGVPSVSCCKNRSDATGSAVVVLVCMCVQAGKQQNRVVRYADSFQANFSWHLVWKAIFLRKPFTFSISVGLGDLTFFFSSSERKHISVLWSGIEIYLLDNFHILSWWFCRLWTYVTFNFHTVLSSILIMTSFSV